MSINIRKFACRINYERRKNLGYVMLNLSQRGQERKVPVLFAALREASAGFVEVQNFEPLQAWCVRSPLVSMMRKVLEDRVASD